MWYRDPLGVYDLGLPVKSWPANGPYFVLILHAEMDTTRSGSLAQTIRRVIGHRGKIFFPMSDEGRRDGLSTNMHEPPPAQIILIWLQFPAVKFHQYILGPGDEQPYDSPLFFAHGLEYILRGYTLQNDRRTPDDETPEPVHLGAGMVEGRNEDKVVVLFLMVGDILCYAGAEHVFMGEEDRFGPAGSARREVQTTGICIGKFDIRWRRLRFFKNLFKRFCIRGEMLPHKDILLYGRHCIPDRIDLIGEFFAEDHGLGFGRINAVFDIIARKTKVQGHDPCSGSHNPKIGY